MTNSKNTKRAFLASALSVVLCTAMFVGSTFAWFTDSATTGMNKIQAGNLKIALQTKDDSGKWVDVGEDPLAFVQLDDSGKEILWEPGCTYKLPELCVANKGNLALKFKLLVNGLSGTENAEAEIADLAEVIDVYTGTVRADVVEENKLGTLRELMSDVDGAAYGVILPDGATLPEGADKTVVVGATDGYNLLFHMQEAAGNKYQDMNLDGISFTLTATQYTYEKDSFDDQYDAGANAEAVFGKDIVDALKNPDVSEVLAGGDIDMNKAEFRESNGNITFTIPDGKTLDLNQNTFVRPEGGSGNGLAFKAETTATVKNGTVFAQGDMCAVDIGEGATVNFEDMHFEGHGNEILKVRADAGSKTTVIFRNCTFNNAPVKISGRNGATEIDIRFVDCAFTGTYKMYDEQGNALADPYGNIHYTNYMINAASTYLYGDITIDGCTFDFDASEAKYGEEAVELYGCYQGNYPGKKLNVLLKDITLTGKKITPVDIDSRYKDGIVVTEQGTNSYTVDDVAVNYDGTKK